MKTITDGRIENRNLNPPANTTSRKCNYRHLFRAWLLMLGLFLLALGGKAQVCVECGTLPIVSTNIEADYSKFGILVITNIGNGTTLDGLYAGPSCPSYNKYYLFGRYYQTNVYSNAYISETDTFNGFELWSRTYDATNDLYVSNVWQGAFWVTNSYSNGYVFSCTNTVTSFAESTSGDSTTQFPTLDSWGWPYACGYDYSTEVSYGIYAPMQGDTNAVLSTNCGQTFTDFSGSLTETDGSGTVTSYSLKESLMVSNEYTTPMLKSNTVVLLTNYVDGQWGTGYVATYLLADSIYKLDGHFAPTNVWPIPETSLILSKARFMFSFGTDAFTSYKVTRTFTCIWSYQTNGSTYVMTNKTIKVMNVITNGNGIYTETDDIEPVLSGGSISFVLNGTNTLTGEPPDNVTQTLALTKVKVEPESQGCPSCAGGGGGGGSGGGGNPPGNNRAGSGLGSGSDPGPQGSFDLGSDSTGANSGSLDINGPGDDGTGFGSYYSPGVITGMGAPGNVTPIYSGGVLRQMGSRQTLADVQTLTGSQGFKIVFYDANGFIPGHDSSTLISTNGLSPIVTWTFANPDVGVSNRLQITETRSGVSVSSMYTRDSVNDAWTLVSGNGLREEVLSNSWDSGHQNRTEVYQVIDPGSSQVKYQRTTVYRAFGVNTSPVKVTEGTGTAIQTTYTGYDTTGNLITITTNIYGGTQTYSYDGMGRIYLEQDTYQNTDIKKTQYDYDNALTGYGDNPALWPTQPRIVTTQIGSAIISKSFFVALNSNTNVNSQATVFTYDPFDSTTLRTTNIFYPTNDPNAGRLKTRVLPDNTIQCYTYGTNTNYQTNIVLVGQPNSTWDGILNGTETITVLGSVGQILEQQTFAVQSGTSNILTSQDLYSYTDDLQRSYNVVHLDGTTNVVEYGCCGLDLTIDRDGLTTQYYYDALKRPTGSTLEQLSITSSNILDANGNTIKTLRIAGGQTNVLSQIGYDTAGRVSAVTNALGGTNLYSYGYDGSGFYVTTVTHPDGGTDIEKYHRDGLVDTVTGTAVPGSRITNSVAYVYPIYASVQQVIKLDTNGADTYESTTTYLDMLGRRFLTAFADPTSPPTESRSFNSLGQLTSQTDADGIPTLYGYNAKGERVFVVQDMNKDGTTNWTGPDRITYSTNDVTTDNGSTVKRTQTYVWNTAANSASLLSVAESSVEGLKRWNIRYNNGSPVTTNFSRTVYTNGYRITTNISPDGSFSVSSYQYGRLLSVTTKDSANTQITQTIYGYDAQGRQNTTTDARNGTTTSYFNNADSMNGLMTPVPGTGQSAEVTSNYFDWSERLAGTKLPDNTYTTNLFFATGQIGQSTGSREYAVGNGFDAQGRMTTMSNWTTFPSAGLRVTTWNYNAYRGWLDNKRYPDSSGPDYTHTPGARLDSRQWARTNSGGRLITSYAYGFEDGTTTNKVGDLIGVSYTNDPTSTPSLTYVYDRLGRRTSIVQGSMTTTIGYNDVGQVTSESYSGGVLAGFSVTNGYDAILRRNKLVLLSNSTAILTITNNYDNASRLQTIGDGTISATYSNLANSSLVGQITFAKSGVTKMTTTKQYDLLNRLTSIASAPSGTNALSFAYGYNSANQRTTLKEADFTLWNFSYDSLGQVASGKKYWPDGNPVPGEQFTYIFDDIGNRTCTGEGGNSSGGGLRTNTYTVNNLNQYSNRTVVNQFDDLGLANYQATVTVNGASTDFRRGEFFQKLMTVTNSSAPVWLTITNTSTISTNSNHLVGSWFVPKTPENYTYDADGNLTQDGRFAYTWDAENRLINITSISGPPSGSLVKLDCTYDSQGRRIQKIVSTNTGSSYVVSATNKFIYDGWNLVAILDGTNKLQQSFVWGSDLSGGMQGAGGVGGLISMTLWTGPYVGTYLYAYDGNGNVAALVNAADGTISARYEYGPFGELLRATGPIAFINPFRFSTKYQDDETELNYYGYRYYSPIIGRWLNRDPLEEKGGRNLYAFANNSPEDQIDPLGLISDALDLLKDCLLEVTKIWAVSHIDESFTCGHISGIARASDDANKEERKEYAKVAGQSCKGWSIRIPANEEDIPVTFLEGVKNCFLGKIKEKGLKGMDDAIQDENKKHAIEKLLEKSEELKPKETVKVISTVNGYCYQQHLHLDVWYKSFLTVDGITFEDTETQSQKPDLQFMCGSMWPGIQALCCCCDNKPSDQKK